MSNIELMSHNIGEVPQNSLSNIIENIDIDNEEPQLFQHSPYMDTDMLINILKTKINTFKCMSLNIQSLYAKFDQLQIYLQTLAQSNCSFDAICIQETWLNKRISTSLIQIEGYTLISQWPSCSTHSGLAIYLKNGIQYKINNITASESNIWEGQFLEIYIDKKKLTLGNIYRPPKNTTENYKTFSLEFQNCLKMLHGEVLIAGDFNIDLLKLNDIHTIHEYLESIISSGYIPKITLPTRLSENRRTLIDNFLCKISNNFSRTTAGILNYNLSDHQPYFICLDYLKRHQTIPRYIHIKTNSQEAIDNINGYLTECYTNWNQNSTINIHENYEQLLNILQTGLRKYLPTKKVKFYKHKYKGSKWITRGIINSIKLRDKLYCKMKKL